MLDIFGSIAGNIAILISLTYLYGLLAEQGKRWHPLLRDTNIGLLFGLFAIVNMLNPLTVAPGIILDLRAVVIFVAALLAGWRGGLVAVILVIMYRVYLGGSGTAAGVVTALTAWVFGAIYYYVRGGDFSRYHETIAMIVFVTVFNAVLTFALIPGVSIQFVFNSIFLPLLIMHTITLPPILFIIQRRNQYERLHEQLKQSEQRFQSIFDRSVQFIGLVDTDGTVLEANQTALRVGNRRPEDVQGNPIWEMVFWAADDSERDRLRQAVQTASAGEAVSYDVTGKWPDASPIRVHFSLQPVKDSTGRVSMLIAEGRDITASLLAERQALDLETERRRNQVMRDFITNTSHHMRTPITIIRSSIDLCRLKANRYTQQAETVQTLDDMLELFHQQMSEIHRRIETVSGAIDNLQSVVVHMLELSRLDAKEHLTFSMIDLTDIVRTTAEEYTNTAQANHQTYNIEAGTAGVSVNGSAEHIEKMLEYLIDNAIRYTPDGGTITVKLTTDDNTATITVIDTGIGITERQQEQMFDEFYRTNEAVQLNAMGVGLGLAYVRRVVEKHKGTIAVSSTPGEGTTIRLNLPLSTVAESQMRDVSAYS